VAKANEMAELARFATETEDKRAMTSAFSTCIRSLVEEMSIGFHMTQRELQEEIQVHRDACAQLQKRAVALRRATRGLQFQMELVAPDSELLLSTITDQVEQVDSEWLPEHEPREQRAKIQRLQSQNGTLGSRKEQAAQRASDTLAEARNSLQTLQGEATQIEQRVHQLKQDKKADLAKSQQIQEALLKEIDQLRRHGVPVKSSNSQSAGDLELTNAIQEKQRLERRVQDLQADVAAVTGNGNQASSQLRDEHHSLMRENASLRHALAEENERKARALAQASARPKQDTALTQKQNERDRLQMIVDATSMEEGLAQFSGQQARLETERADLQTRLTAAMVELENTQAQLRRKS